MTQRLTSVAEWQGKRFLRVQGEREKNVDQARRKTNPTRVPHSYLSAFESFVESFTLN